jgi:hypothetical protein
MTHTTPAGKTANKLVRDAVRLERVATPETHEQALDNRQQAAHWRHEARLQDLSVREVALRKTLKNGVVREYKRWIASWRVGSRIKTVYLGPSQGPKSISESEALDKARRMKQESLEG